VRIGQNHPEQGEKLGLKTLQKRFIDVLKVADLTNPQESARKKLKSVPSSRQNPGLRGTLKLLSA